jgi:hypothetical protein
MGLLYKSDLSDGERKGDPKKTAVAPSGNANKEIAAYVARHPKLSGVLFDFPHSTTKEETAILSGLLRGAVSSIGIAMKVRSDSRSTRTLVLIPASLDNELVSHRIRVNFQIKKSRIFPSISLDDVQTILKKY